jgi:hypothetical protein
LSLRTARTTHEARHEGIREELAAAVTKSPGTPGAFFLHRASVGLVSKREPLLFLSLESTVS